MCPYCRYAWAHHWMAYGKHRDVYQCDFCEGFFFVPWSTANNYKKVV